MPDYDVLAVDGLSIIGTVGFFVPAALAVVSHWLSYPVMFVGGVVLAALSLGVVLMFSRKHLPSALAH